jgi:tyrosine-protein kinase Etk/Wzc
MEELQQRQASLNDYMQLLYRGRWIILTSFVVVMAVTAYLTFTTDPVYEATAKVMIKEEGGMQSTLFDINGLMKKETMINNQVEILRSRSLAEAVIKDLQNSDRAQSLRLLYPDQRDDDGGFVAGAGKWFGGLLNRQDSTGERSFDEVVEDFRRRISIIPIRDTDMIELRVTASTPDEAAFITNTLAAAYNETNRLASQEEVHQVKNFLSEQVQIIQKELVDSEEALKAYKENEKVVALTKETEELIKKLAEFETLYNEALTELNSNKQRLEYIDKQLAHSRANFDLKSVSATPYFEQIRRQIAEIEGKKAAFMAGLMNEGLYDVKDPQIRRYDEQIELLTNSLRTEIAKVAKAEIPNPIAINEDLFKRKIEVEASLQALQPRVSALKRIVDEYSRQLESLPEKSLKLARLERAARVDEKLYLMMQEKFEESRITEVAQLGNVRLIDPAKPPKYPIKPRKKVNMLLGVLAGLGLGIGLTFLLEYVDNSLRTIEDLERLGVTVLGSIPRIKEEEAVKRMKFLPSVNGGQNGASNGHSSHGHAVNQEARRIAARLITHFAPKSPISEAYRAFRTNIQYTRLDKPLRAILLTSPGPGEGKSTSGANLAITMAQMGSKVLLIDTDLRRPVLHSIFKLDKRMGLTNVLVGRNTLDEVVQATEIENLSLLTSGPLPPNPSELLGSGAMRQTLEEIKSKYDIAIFDTPPIIAVTDAAVLGSILDGIIIVINSGHTDRNAALRSFALLNNLKSRLLGALLNGVDIESMYGSYYYYYHYYYYGRDGEKPRRKKRSQV